jgi:hypothetical protein
MIGLYCQKFHLGANGLCSDCASLDEYALTRTDKCQFGDQKPACSKCPVHCYTPIKREEIKTVMRYAGPRMIYTYPYLAVMHIVDKNRSRNYQNKISIEG